MSNTKIQNTIDSCLCEDQEIQLADGYEDAFVGIATQFDRTFAVYDRASPVLYLESLFEKWGGIPFPSQLCGERSMTIFSQYLEKGETVGQMEFENEIRILNNYLNNPNNKEKELDDVLLLDFLPIKSYTRVLLCSDNIFDKLKKYTGTAIAELKSNPSTNKYIKENYVSRYIRLFPQRISKSINSEYNEIPEPSSGSQRREDVPIRRRPSNT